MIDFLIARFQWFQNLIRKEDIEVNRDRVAKFYTYLYFVIAIFLLIGAIILFINPENGDKINLWAVIVTLVVGMSGILYCNLSKNFIMSIEQVSDK
jgi:RsiW-degrading membrane proteinase PrsW (M82 family)